MKAFVIFKIEGESSLVDDEVRDLLKLWKAGIFLLSHPEVSLRDLSVEHHAAFFQRVGTIHQIVHKEKAIPYPAKPSEEPE